VYVRDTGLLHHLLGITTESELLAHPKCGASWEGYAIEEVIHAVRPDDTYFWATHQGAELDLLLFRNGRRLGVEVKRTDAPRLTPSMRIALEDLKLEQLVVLLRWSLDLKGHRPAQGQEIVIAGDQNVSMPGETERKKRTVLRIAALGDRQCRFVDFSSLCEGQVARHVSLDIGGGETELGVLQCAKKFVGSGPDDERNRDTRTPVIDQPGQAATEQQKQKQPY
jgi:hypothetical protein